MSIIHLENEDFDNIIKRNKVIVDFYADWCGPCKMLGPVMESVSKKNEDITFVKVDVDKFDTIARKYGVMSIPTVIRFENGNVKDKKLGFMPETEFEKFIK